MSYTRYATVSINSGSTSTNNGASGGWTTFSPSTVQGTFTFPVLDEVPVQVSDPVKLVFAKAIVQMGLRHASNCPFEKCSCGVDTATLLAQDVVEAAKTDKS